MNDFYRFAAHLVQAWRTVGIRGSHSLTQFIKMGDFSVEILPALQDNYMYLVCIDDNGFNNWRTI